ncbi:tripartite tricarboxylate transporter permease [Roseinatronobacter thiooxidans]|nr:tripartite tricarboxylate transporter permease [Roseinatronobacter thiooxidans]
MTGVYALNNNPTDIAVMIVFGVVGFLLRQLDYRFHGSDFS